jgi:uncharacterized protein (DUF305 family)
LSSHKEIDRNRSLTMRKRMLVAALAVTALTAGVATATVASSHPGAGAGMTGPGPRGAGPMGRGAMGDGPMSGGAMGPRSGMHGSHVDSEFAYLTQMIPHHEEAVAAAEELLARSDRQEMKDFARSIIATQTAQIDEMKADLALWYPGRDTTAEYTPMMRDLSQLAGDELDQAFLEDMIPHHGMAVMMSQSLLSRGLAEHQEVTDLATTIRDEQRAEIMTMMEWLRTWFGASAHGHGHR